MVLDRHKYIVESYSNLTLVKYIYKKIISEIFSG